MAVKSLKKQFKEAFGATLRVYMGNQYEDDADKRTCLR